MAIAAMLAACSTSQQAPAVSLTAVSVTDAATAEPPATVASDPSVDYRIGPMDILDIAVFQVPDLTKEVQVSQSGQITLPLIGTIAAGGKTALELQTDIATQLGAKYLQSPQVTVSVKDSLSQQVTVEGAVAKPGVFPSTGTTTLLQAIALSGGLTDSANDRAIVILRQVNGQRQAAKFDYSAILAAQAEDPVLSGGDVIVVDQSGLKTAWHSVLQSLPVFGLFKPLL